MKRSQIVSKQLWNSSHIKRKIKIENVACLQVYDMYFNKVLNVITYQQRHTESIIACLQVYDMYFNKVLNIITYQQRHTESIIIFSCFILITFEIIQPRRVAIANEINENKLDQVLKAGTWRGVAPAFPVPQRRGEGPGETETEN